MAPPWTVWSNILAAGMPPINTVALPLAIVSGGPVQVTKSVARAAGMFESALSRLLVLRESYPEMRDASVETVGITDTWHGDDHCWADFFTRVVDIKKPSKRVRYDLDEIGEPSLKSILEEFIK